MNRSACLFVLGSALSILFAACAPKKPPAPPPRDAATVEREWLYGPRGGASDIAWQRSGLGIRVLTAGEGVAPKSTDRVRVNFKCVLKDGKVIDESQARGGPVDLTVSRLIPGWAEGMAVLKPGGRAEFFIPPSLGYGMSAGAGIPSGAGLIFEVELLAVNPEPITGKKP